MKKKDVVQAFELAMEESKINTHNIALKLNKNNVLKTDEGMRCYITDADNKLIAQIAFNDEGATYYVGGKSRNAPNLHYAIANTIKILNEEVA